MNDVVQCVLPDVRFFFQTLALKFDNWSAFKRCIVKGHGFLYLFAKSIQLKISGLR